MSLLRQPVGPRPSRASIPGLRRALIIGINYEGTRYALRGCINDAEDIRGQVTTFFPTCKEIRLITDRTIFRPTRSVLLASIAWLMDDLLPGEHVLFHYSGHGGRIADVNSDEASGLDSCLYAVERGVLQRILDDELRAALADRVPQGSKCLMIIDSCHSGTAVDLRYTWQAPAAQCLTYAETPQYRKTGGMVVALTSCLDSEVAADTQDERRRPCGALTMALLRVWRTYGPGIKFKHLLWDVRALLRQKGYAQVPQLSTGLPYDMNAAFDLSAP